MPLQRHGYAAVAKRCAFLAQRHGGAHARSVTLDPAFDSPEALKTYAGYHRSDPQIWSFTTGDDRKIDALTRAFSVYRQTEGGTISHGLATVLIDKDGKIAQIWRGNAWKPLEVIEQIKQHGD